MTENSTLTRGASSAPQQPEQNFITTSGDRKYFTILPNIVDDSNLSPAAVRLYFHFKRVAGESGACWQSTVTMAAACNMSVGRVSTAKSELAARGFISVEEKKNPKGGKPYHNITIADVWRENVLRYSTKEASSIYEVASSNNEVASSIYELKNNTLRRTHEEDNNPVIVFSETLQKGYEAIDINLEQQPFQGYSEATLQSFLAWLQQQKITGLKAENVARKLLPSWEVNPTTTKAETFITAAEFMLQRG